MPQPNKIPLAFAASGDKNTIPESTETTGLASWREGFPAITSAPFSEGGIAPKRADFNGIFNSLSAAIVWMQQGGLWTYDNTVDYEPGNIIVANGVPYVCLTANGPSSSIKDPIGDTTNTCWAAVVTMSQVTPTGGARKIPITTEDGFIPQNVVGAYTASGQSHIVKLADGTMFEFGLGYFNGPNATGSIIFPEAFIETPIVMLTSITAGQQTICTLATISAPTVAGFDFIVNRIANGGAVSYVNSTAWPVYWLAIGRWE